MKNPQAYLFALNNILLVSNNPLLSKNTQALSITYNNTAIKLKRNRVYFNKEGDRHTASSADRKHLTFIKFNIKYNIKRAELSPLNNLYFFN